jgi:tRNA dimethylallyltransferase
VNPTAAILCGPTATGKTALAVQLAALVPIEIISADSRQVYRHLDVGTAKPTAAERAAVAHHLIDFMEFDETYNAARFAADARRLAGEIRGRGRVPLVVGGAGFYLHVLETGLFDAPYEPEMLARVRSELAAWPTDTIRAALERRDPERAAALHPNDRQRLARALEICIASGRTVTELTAARTVRREHFVRFRIAVERPELHRRIAARTAALFDAGWRAEVEALLQRGTSPGAPALATLGYPHVVALARGELEYAAAFELVLRDTRRFARHQETWFRKLGDASPVRPGDAQAPAVLAARLRREFGV